jgi:hypothetical protein
LLECHLLVHYWSGCKLPWSMMQAPTSLTGIYISSSLADLCAGLGSLEPPGKNEQANREHYPGQ